MSLTRRAALLSAAAVPLAGAGAAGPDLVMPLVAAPRVLIPGITADPGARLVGGKIYGGLLRRAPDGTPQPELAETVEPAESGLRYTFHLRGGVTWHDGGGFGAEDVVFSLGRFHPAFQPGLKGWRVEAPDPLTAVLTLPEPVPGVLERLDALSLPIVPRHVHDVPGFATDPRQAAPVGTGPFRYAEWLRLVRFEWFVGPRPALPGLLCPVLPSPAACTEMLRVAAPALVVGAAVDRAGLARLRSDPGLTVTGETPRPPTVAGVRLDAGAAPLDQPEVRRALAFAVDRAAALREAWNGLGRVATGPEVGGPADMLPRYDPRAAAALLNAAGLRPDDAGIRARLGYRAPADQALQALLPVLRRALGQVGIAVEPVEEGAAAMTGFDAAPPDGTPAAAASAAAAMDALWLVEPAIPVAQDRRLLLPAGVFGNFAEAVLA